MEVDFDLDKSTLQFLKNIKKFQKELGNERTVKRIHRKAGKKIEDAMEANIKDSREEIWVAGRSRPVMPGQYKDSIKVWLIERGGTSYFAGPQTGRKAPTDADAWFQTFVESGDTYLAQQYGGTGGNRNIGAIERAKRKSIGPALRQMKKDYEKAIARAAKAAAKGKK
jgi:hypothetical protein